MRMSACAATATILMLAASANAATITLKAGDYGAAGLACDEQPNASTMSFDGRSFSYAHASKCTDRITRKQAGVMTIVETCRAAGDGSPTDPYTRTLNLRQNGSDGFTLIKSRSAGTFRRCGPLGYFIKH